MPRSRKAAPARRTRRARASITHQQNNTERTSEQVTTLPKPGQAATFWAECPICGASFGHTTITIGPYGRTLVNCFRCGQTWDKSYAEKLSELLGVRLGQLLTDPLKHLEPWMNGTKDAPAMLPPAALPTQAALRAAVRRLRTDERRMRYLLATRGLTRRTVRTYKLGWDGSRYVFPVYNGDELVNVIRHWPHAKRRYLTKRGYPADLYPRHFPEGKSVILCAGVFCALLARQAGLPAVTSTVGCSLPDPLPERFAGKRVAICYDAGEETAAGLVMDKLFAAGAEDAWVVELPLPHGGDIADLLTKQGWTAEDIVQLIKDQRKKR